VKNLENEKKTDVDPFIVVAKALMIAPYFVFEDNDNVS